jgi:hypothetical protein
MKPTILSDMKVAMLLVLAGLSIAQAAEPTGMLTLACQGTSTIHVPALNDPPLKQEVSMGIFVDFTARTVVAPYSRHVRVLPLCL